MNENRGKAAGELALVQPNDLVAILRASWPTRSRKLVTRHFQATP